MRKRFCLLLIVSLAVVGFMAPVQADEGTPVAVVENDSFYFGTVFEGDEAIHDFIIKNKGDADLKILDVKAG